MHRVQCCWLYHSYTQDPEFWTGCSLINELSFGAKNHIDVCYDCTLNLCKRLSIVISNASLVDTLDPGLL
jgi:hypothetical protein